MLRSDATSTSTSPSLVVPGDTSFVPASASQRLPKSWPLSAAAATSRLILLATAGGWFSIKSVSSLQLSGLGVSVYAQYLYIRCVALESRLERTRTVRSGLVRYSHSEMRVGSARVASAAS